jgi:hypothetical protein
MLKWISIASIAVALWGPQSFAVAQDCDATATIGSGGSAAAGGTAASTLGTAGACRTGTGTTSSIGSAGSAASADGKASSNTKIVDNPAQLKAQSKAQAMDQGTFSKSKTKVRVKGDRLDSSTRTMSHAPGGKPEKSVSDTTVILPPQ